MVIFVVADLAVGNADAASHQFAFHDKQLRTASRVVMTDGSQVTIFGGPVLTKEGDRWAPTDPNAVFACRTQACGS